MTVPVAVDVHYTVLIGYSLIPESKSMTDIYYCDVFLSLLHVIRQVSGKFIFQHDGIQGAPVR